MDTSATSGTFGSAPWSLQDLLDRRLGLGLGVEVDGRRDPQAAADEVVEPLGLGLAERVGVLEQPLLHRVDEVRRRVGHGLRRWGRRGEGQRRRARRRRARSAVM